MNKFRLIILIFTAPLARAVSLLDTTFAVGAGADGIVEQVLMQPDGKVLICGNFLNYNNAPKPYMARLNSDGSLDATFDAHPSYWTRHMALQTDGKIIICGYFTSVAGATRNRFARLNADGSLDTTFDPGSAMETSVGAGIDGNNDPFVFWVDLQADGKIIATGNFRTYNGDSSPGIVRINSDGSRDATFNVGQGLDSWGRSIRVLSSGQILVSGWFTSYNGSGGHRLVRINPNGTRDASLNPFYGDKTSIYSVVEQPGTGKLITAGHSINEEGLFRQEVVRLNADGTFDQSWVGNTNEKTECLLMQRDGKVILSGYFNLVNGVSRRGLARLNADGTLDSTFVADADNYVWTVAPGPTGRIYVSGGFNTIDGLASRGVARITVPNSGASTNLPPTAPKITNARVINNRFECSILAEAGYTYVLQFKDAAAGANWSALPSQTGNGSPMLLTDPNFGLARYYRVEAR